MKNIMLISTLMLTILSFALANDLFKFSEKKDSLITPTTNSKNELYNYQWEGSKKMLLGMKIQWLEECVNEETIYSGVTQASWRGGIDIFEWQLLTGNKILKRQENYLTYFNFGEINPNLEYLVRFKQKGTEKWTEKSLDFPKP